MTWPAFGPLLAIIQKSSH